MQTEMEEMLPPKLTKNQKKIHIKRKIARKHLIEYFVCAHFLKYLIRDSMDLDFLPT